MYANNISGAGALQITGLSMAIVFLVLLLISYMIEFIYMLLKPKSSEKEKNIEVSEEVVEDFNTDREHLALIMAAISVYMEDKTCTFRVRSIKKNNEELSSWQRSLVSQNGYEFASAKPYSTQL